MNTVRKAAAITIRIPTPLREYTQGADEVLVDAANVGQALEILDALHEGVLARILDEDGEPRQFVNIYLGDRDIRAMDGLQTVVRDGDVVSIIPGVAGGSADEI